MSSFGLLQCLVGLPSIRINPSQIRHHIQIKWFDLQCSFYCGNCLIRTPNHYLILNSVAIMCRCAIRIKFDRSFEFAFGFRPVPFVAS